MDQLDKKIAKHVVLWLIVLIILSGTYKLIRNAGQNPDSDLYQVVLLNNNQVFYGKLHKISSHYPYLTDVYYLNPQTPEVDNKGRVVGGQGQKFTVVKRGIDEIHQPIDKMYFEESNIIYWENIGTGSLVARGIAKDKEYRAGLAEAAALTAEAGTTASE